MAVTKRTTSAPPPPAGQDPQLSSDTPGAAWPTKSVVRKQRRADRGERNLGGLQEEPGSRRAQRHRGGRGDLTGSAGLKSSARQPATKKAGFGQWLFPWLRCLLVAWVYVVALKVVSAAGEVAVIVLFTTPAIITTLYLPSSRRRSWRWLVIWLIVNIVNPTLFLPAALVATTWALHQFWVVERPDTHRTPLVGPALRSLTALVSHPMSHPLRGSLRKRPGGRS